jgi:hypothetical protein
MAQRDPTAIVHPMAVSLKSSVARQHSEEVEAKLACWFATANGPRGAGARDTRDTLASEIALQALEEEHERVSAPWRGINKEHAMPDGKKLTRSASFTSTASLSSSGSLWTDAHITPSASRPESRALVHRGSSRSSGACTSILRPQCVDHSTATLDSKSPSFSLLDACRSTPSQRPPATSSVPRCANKGNYPVFSPREGHSLTRRDQLKTRALLASAAFRSGTPRLGPGSARHVGSLRISNNSNPTNRCALPPCSLLLTRQLHRLHEQQSSEQLRCLVAVLRARFSWGLATI